VQLMTMLLTVSVTIDFTQMVYGTLIDDYVTEIRAQFE
jgi:hypothetical protein